MPPDQKRPLDTYYDSERGRLATYQLEVSRYHYFSCFNGKNRKIQCCGVNSCGKVSHSNLIVMQGPVVQRAYSALSNGYIAI